MQKLIIIGAGSTGKRIYEFVKSYGLFDVIGFASEPEYVKSPTGGGQNYLLQY